MLLRSINAKRAVIYDPALGIRNLALQDLSKHFTGVVLELSPAANFQKVDATVPIHLSSLWSQMSGFSSALIQVTERLLADRTERIRIGTAGQALYQERFEIRHTIQALRGAR